MLCLAYLSSAVPLMSDDTLEELLRKSRASNARRQITGILLYAGGNILQVLEGPDAEVEDVFRRISADPRHRGVIVMLRMQVEERQFPSWSMAFRRIDHPIAAELPGVSDFLEYDGEAAPLASDATKAWLLLGSFKQMMR